MRVYSYADGSLLIAAMDALSAGLKAARHLGHADDALLGEVSVFDMTTITLPQAADDTHEERQVPLREYVRHLEPGDPPEVIGGTTLPADGWCASRRERGGGHGPNSRPRPSPQSSPTVRPPSATDRRSGVPRRAW